MDIRSTLLGAIGLFSFAVHGQTEVSIDSGRFDYGVGVNFTAPTVNKNSTGFSSQPGFGLGFNTLYGNKQSQVRMSNRLHFSRYSYLSPEINSTLEINNVEFYLGFQYKIPSLEKSAFYVHAVPSYAAVFSVLQGNNSNGNSSVRKNLSNDLKNEFNVGAYVAFELELSPGVGLELGYLFQPIKAQKEFYFDAKPGSFRLAVNLTFGQFLGNKTNKEVVADQLTDLQKQTLYVLNKSCSERMTNEVLDSLFKLHYKFSRYIIISESQISSVLDQGNASFFALVGEFYAGLDEPVTEGIYLLDRDFQLVSYPYPVYTKYENLGTKKPCFDDFETAAKTISNFNRRLTSRSSD